MNSSDLMTGVSGEHLACFDLISKGHTAFMTEQGLPYDLIADIDGRLLKVQVKTTRTYSEMTQRAGSYQSYTFHVRQCGRGGKKHYRKCDVDLFALVCVETKQVGYIRADIMPMTLSVRVDEFRGNYMNEIQEARAKMVFTLKLKGMTNSDIGREIGMNKSVVGKVLSGLSKKREHGAYFSDLTLESAL